MGPRRAAHRDRRRRLVDALAPSSRYYGCELVPHEVTSLSGTHDGLRDRKWFFSPLPAVIKTTSAGHVM